MPKSKRRRRKRKPTLFSRLSGLCAKVVLFVGSPWRLAFRALAAVVDGVLRADLKQANQQIDELLGENEVLKDQLSMMHDWREREQSRLQAEAAIHAARRARAVDIAMRSDDELGEMT